MSHGDGALPAILIRNTSAMKTHANKGTVFLAAVMTFGEQFLFRTQVLTNLHCNVFTKAWANEFEMLFKVKAVWAALVVVFFAVQFVEWFIRSRWVLFLQVPDNPRHSISKPRDELHREFYIPYQAKPLLSTDHSQPSDSLWQ
jgi:hypothetical protein